MVDHLSFAEEWPRERRDHNGGSDRGEHAGGTELVLRDEKGHVGASDGQTELDHAVVLLCLQNKAWQARKRSQMLAHNSVGRTTTA